MAQLNYPLVMSEIKRQLKRARVSYAELAGLLDIPESTLKKWLAAKDGNFSRINLIAETLGIPVHALIKAVEEQRVLTLTFSSSQQSLFAKDTMAFRAYWLLVYERMNEAEVMSALRLTPAAFKTLLYKLDREKLLEVGLKDKVKVPKMKPVRWTFKGPFMQKLFSEWSQDLITDSWLEKENSRLHLQFFQLTPESADEFGRELDALEEKYARRTILELNTNSGERKQIRYLLCTANGSFIK